MGYCVETRHANSLLVMGRESFTASYQLAVRNRSFGAGFVVFVVRFDHIAIGC